MESRVAADDPNRPSNGAARQCKYRERARHPGPTRDQRFGSLTWRDSRTATAGRADAWLKVPREVNRNPPPRKGRRCPDPPIGGVGANFRGVWKVDEEGQRVRGVSERMD